MEQKYTIAAVVAGVIVAAIIIMAAIGGLVFMNMGGEEESGYKYAPTVDLPERYIVVADHPVSQDEMTAIAALSCLVVKPDHYNPLFILEEGALNSHMLFTLENLEGNTDPVLLFTNNPNAATAVAAQCSEIGLTFDPELNTYPLTGDVAGQFKGFDDAIPVGTYEEALWVAPLAKQLNKVIVKTPTESTYSTQEAVWAELNALGVPFNYLVVTNPYDVTMDVVKLLSPGYMNQYNDPNSTYPYKDEQYHVDALSCMSGQLAAFRDAYVLTRYTPSQEPIGYMDYELNERSIGYFMAIRNITQMYNIPEYICIVGSAAAVPQFQFPDTTDDDPNRREGDGLVSSDVAYGFLDVYPPEDDFEMDCAVGRIINLNLAGCSNSLARTFAYERINLQVTAQFNDGPRTVDWSKQGASFSGYEITYKRMQATPGRFICKDYEDEGLEYHYVAPSGMGNVLDLDPWRKVTRTEMADMNAIMQSNIFVAYRGHGSDYNSLYLTPYAWGNEDAVLRGEEVRDLYLPPQIGFYVSCMNAKIHGGGWASRPDPVSFDKLFGVNCLYGGAVAHGGATEVSFSNIGQDIWVAGAEINPANDDYQWDLNDAWYAFFWDGILNHEEDHGTVGKALQWAENRYIRTHDNTVTPFKQAKGSAHWKETAMFVIYGDPAHMPHNYNMGPGSEDKWHNGKDDM